ncbi:DinB family protein [Neobacillus niacini]|uniref:DinB family protein n=1 Tax=Neobacillus niacini TaxID=86668 RepID=UPI002864E488|nr:DinB family protein [Neobacillus niacini]MDR6999820.1 putative damage-inducible protein DinB [Neobacillus niacini]
MVLSVETKLKYHHWANLKLLQHIKGLKEDVSAKEVKSIFPSLSVIFKHIYSVDSMWLKRISGVKASILDAVNWILRKRLYKLLNSFTNNTNS